MLLGGLLTKGIKAAVKSVPYKKFRKTAMTDTADLYKKAKKTDPSRKSFKDKKFMRGLQKLDTQRAKASRLMDMSQFLIKEARRSGRKDMTKVGRKLRRGVFGYGRNISSKAKAMINRKTQKKKLN